MPFGSSGGALNLPSVSEDVVLSTVGPTTNTTIDIPANAYLVGVSYLITETITGVDSANLRLEGATSGIRLGTWATSLTQDESGVGFQMHSDATPFSGSVAEKIKILLMDGADNTPLTGAVHVMLSYLPIPVPMS